MVNKRAILAGLIAAIMMFVVVVEISTKDPVQAKEVSVTNAKSPPEDPIAIKTLELSGDIDSIVCQQPSKGNEYGGIGGSDSNPPKGTTTDPELTVQYNRPTATGVCGTYWYIAGWWFNASEMAKLPQESIMYGVSPYAITTGSDGAVRTGNSGNGGSNNGNDGSNNGNDGPNNDNDGFDNGDDGDGPIIPVPEVATIIMVMFGIFVLITLTRIKR